MVLDDAIFGGEGFTATLWLPTTPIYLSACSASFPHSKKGD